MSLNSTLSPTFPNATSAPTSNCGIPPWTPQMTQAVAVVPKITAMMSMIAVSIIIYRVVAMKKSSRRVYDRLLLGMSVMNFFGSFAFFLGTWTYSNAGFCTLQGWLLQINSAVFWYNGVLATNFLLRIVFEWKEHDTEMIEPYLHAIAWTFPVITSFVCLGLGMYSHAGPWCWIASPPFDWARWALFYAELWCLMMYCAVVMLVIVLKVDRSDRKSRQFQASGAAGGAGGGAKKKRRMSRRTREVALQGVFFVVAFWLTWVFGSANRIQNALAPAGCTIFALVFLHSWFVPWQGFLNFLVFMFPRFLEMRSQRLDASLASKSAESLVDHRSCAERSKQTAVYVLSFFFGGELAERSGPTTRPRRGSNANTTKSWIESEVGQKQADGESPRRAPDEEAEEEEEEQEERQQQQAASTLPQQPPYVPRRTPLDVDAVNVRFASNHESVTFRSTPMHTDGTSWSEIDPASAPAPPQAAQQPAAAAAGAELELTET